MSELPAPRPGLVMPRRTSPAGEPGPTKADAGSPEWRRTSRGLYVPAYVEQSVDQRIYEAAVLIPDYGALTGWAALHWQGARWFDGIARDGATERPVVIGVPHHEINAQPGILVSSEWLPPRHLMAYDGLPLTIPVRSVGWEARYAKTLELAVMALDMGAYNDLVSIIEMLAHCLIMTSRIGVPLLRAALLHMDENSWSPMETLMRLLWIIECGFPRPLCNHPVFDLSGQHIGTPDFIDVEAGVVGEYGGKLHLEGAQRSTDLRREDAFRRVGLEYFEMVAADRADPDRTILRRMRETRARARFEAETRRAWTVVPPAWWTPTVTVDQRRALSADQRTRLLRNRVA